MIRLTSPESGVPRTNLVPGLLAVVAALVLLGNGNASFDGGSPNSRALGVVLPPLALGLAAAVLCVPLKPAAGLALLGATLSGVGRGLLYDPVRDRACIRCLPSPFAIRPDQRLADVSALIGGLLIVAALAIAFVRHRSVAAAVGLVVTGVSTTAYDTPHGLRVGAVRVLVAVAGASLILAAVRLTVARRAMTRLTDALGSGRSPDDVLKAHLHDRDAWVEFATPGMDPARWITATGSPVSAPPSANGGARAEHATVVSSRGTSVARIHHTRPLITIPPELIMRLEQAGLEAGLAYQVTELAASRTRIVERADTERRQLERDLHDGAQQYLLALAVDLALTDPGATSDVLEESRRDAEAALEELRTIARGVYPVLLTAGGLAPALQELSRRIGTKIAVHGASDTEMPSAAAAALYALVEELTTSKPARLDVRVSGREPLVIAVDGGTIVTDSLNLERVAASGGNVEIMPGRIVVSFS